MRKILKVFRYIKPFRIRVISAISFNILSAFFALFSIMFAIPFLEVLFGDAPKITTVGQLEFNRVSITEHFYYFLGQIIESRGSSTALVYVCILVVTMTLLKSLFTFFSNYHMAAIRHGVVYRIRHDLYDKITSLPLGFFSEERKGDLMSRMTNDVNEIEVSIIRSLQQLFRDPLQVLIYITALFISNYRLTLFILILLPVTGALLGYITRSLRRKSARAQRQLGVILSSIEETLSGLRIIKAFNAQGKMRERFDRENSDYTHTMVKMSRREYLASPTSEFLGTIFMVMIMYYGATLVFGNMLKSSELIAYLGMFYLILTPAKSLTGAWTSVQRGVASIDRVETILRAESNINDSADARPVKDFVSGIQYKNLWFRYAESWVLKNINVTIKKGETVALVGQSGSGKSTFVDLLPRFYDPELGEILIDGTSVKNLKIYDLRGLMGNVNQESILFNDSVFNNIAFGVEHATIDQVIAAAKIANAHEFISNMPEGYHTNIGDRGSKLSGGQRQRISIARAVLKNPPILILDEATSALDTESEKLVQEALNNLMSSRTSIVIAHRLSTVKNADVIYVLHEGEIVESGTHEQLVSHNGVYNKLLTMQMVS